MKVLGIDPSLTAFGWALHDTDASGRLRRIDSGHEKTLTTTVPVARYIHLRAVVETLLLNHDPDVVGIESPAFEAGPFQTIHFALMMFSMEAIFNRRKDLVLFDPATLKYLVRGGQTGMKGITTKEDVQRFVSLDTMDPNIIDNNEADAYAIAFFAGKFKQIQDGLIKPESLNANEMSVFISKSKTVKTLKGFKKVRIGHVFRENNRYYAYSKVPPGEITLPRKSEVNPSLMSFLEETFTD